MQSSIVAKLLTVLTVVSEAARPHTFSELVTATGLNKSTLHRILALATQGDLLQHDERNRTYLLGTKVFELVRNAHRGHDIQAVALDEMLRLHALTSENVTLGVPHGSQTMYLRLLETPHSNGPIARPGMHEAFHCSASGKALAAFLPDSMIRAKIKDYRFERHTARTITSVEGFLQAVEQTRSNGYAINDREEYEHFVGISAPVFDHLCEPIAVLNIWSLHQRCPLEQLCRWADELMSSAARVTELIGGRAPRIGALGGGRDVQPADPDTLGSKARR